MSLHASFIDDASRKAEYLSKVFPAIELGAKMLAQCKDKTNNMQCAASEDDNMESSQTLHGATSVYLGLVSSAKVAAALGKSSLADRWGKRATELKAAILSFYNEKEGHFDNEGWRGGEWIIFPAALLPAGDRLIKNQADYIREAKVLPIMAPGTEGLNYLGEKLLALAVAYRGDDQRLGELKSWLDFIINNALTKETGHLGEVTLAGDFNGDGKNEFVNVTSIPHVWEATVLSLTFMAVYHPELFDILGGGSDADAGVAPDSSYADAGPGGRSSGCGCSTLSLEEAGPAATTDPMTILRRMCDHLKSLPQYSFSTEVLYDELNAESQITQYSFDMITSVRQPDRMRINSVGDRVNKEFLFDGKTITLYDATARVYGQIAAPGNIEVALQKAHKDFGLRLPLADLASPLLLQHLEKGLKRARYEGLYKVRGIPCHHLSLDKGDARIQIWVDAGDQPLLRKVVFTTRRPAGPMQWTGQIMEWQTAPKLGDKLFQFTAPPGEQRIKFIPRSSTQQPPKQQQPKQQPPKQPGEKP
jgi:hypothetical protein